MTKDEAIRRWLAVPEAHREALISGLLVVAKLARQTPGRQHLEEANEAAAALLAATSDN